MDDEECKFMFVCKDCQLNNEYQICEWCESYYCDHNRVQCHCAVYHGKCCIMLDDVIAECNWCICRLVCEECWYECEKCKGVFCEECSIFTENEIVLCKRCFNSQNKS